MLNRSCGISAKEWNLIRTHSSGSSLHSGSDRSSRGKPVGIFQNIQLCWSCALALCDSSDWQCARPRMGMESDV